MDAASVASNEASLKRRKVRKGTHSCWECRRRKIKCLYSPDDGAVCISCKNSSRVCRSQEFSEDSKAAPSTDRSVAQRLRRLEDLVSKLVNRFMPEEMNDQDQPVSGEKATRRSILLLSPPGQDDVRQSLDMLEDSVAESVEGNPLGLSLGLRNVYTRSPSSLTLESDRAAIAMASGKSQPRLSRQEHVQKLLYALLPVQHDLKLVTQASPNFNFMFANLFYRFRDVISGRAPPPDVSVIIPPEISHPAVLARMLLMLATAIQQLPPAFDRSGLNTRQPLDQVMTAAIKAVSELVTCNDELVGNAEGLQSLILLGVWHVKAGNLRKSWLNFRRALTIAQLIGIDRSGSGALKWVDATMNPQHRVTPEALWFRINHQDRQLSLLLGLPIGSPDESFATEESLKGFTDVEQLERRQTVIAGRVAKRNEDKTFRTYALSQAIDRDLRAMASSMGNEWFAIPEIEPENFDISRVHEMARLSLQIHHFDLLLLVHLPYMLDSRPQASYLCSKMTCMHSSREVLRRFLVFRTFASGAYLSRQVDYAALTAAMTLLLSYLRQDEQQQEPQLTCMERQADRKLVETVRERLLHQAVISQDRLCRESADIIERMMPILNAVDISLLGKTSVYSSGVIKAMHLNVPFLGTISIQPSVGARPCPEQHGQGPIRQASMADTPLSGVLEDQPMDIGTLNTAPMSNAGVINGMFMELQSQMNGEFLELPDMNAEAADWAFQGVDTAYWSMVNRWE